MRGMKMFYTVKLNGCYFDELYFEHGHRKLKEQLIKQFPNHKVTLLTKAVK